jgi:hypothetical protein
MLGVLRFAAMIKQLRIRRVYKRTLSLPPGYMNQYVDNRLQISSYSYGESSITIVSQYKLIFLIM